LENAPFDGNHFYLDSFRFNAQIIPRN
jgi:hypothetical protein